jgi:hypothetical protein
MTVLAQMKTVENLIYMEICNHCKKDNSMSALYLAVTYLKDLTNIVTNHTILPDEQTISGLLIVFAQSSWQT